MWPFNKKKFQQNTPVILFETIICIPGEWNNLEEFTLAIIDSSNGDYIVAGDILINVKKQNHYSIEFCDHDERMRKSFEVAGLVTGITE